MSFAEDHRETTKFPDPYSLPLEKLDVSDSGLFSAQEHWRYFERLRKEDPVHYCPDSEFGPYWSITKFKDIVAVDSNFKVFSSDKTIVIADPREGEDEFDTPMFIAMDPPRHDVQRKAVTPAVAPANLAKLEGLIRERVCKILDDLPVGEAFDWVDRVSIELTTQMLATLFDFPWEDRRKLTRWSDISTAGPDLVGTEYATMTEEDRRAELEECLAYFLMLWEERRGNGDGTDFISLLATNPDTKEMITNPYEILGNLILLIVGGNDTTRNSISGGLLALNQNPKEFEKLKANPALVPSMVSEIIRWVTPLAHMRRTALEDYEIGGKTIKKGDKVVMWYISGNRDDEEIDRPNEFIIDRDKARHHLSFGFGIHRCMGNRVGEMQLRILWEEILNRFDHVEVVGDAKRLDSNFVMGITEMPVVLHPKKA
ncbi:MAG: cytochrome P450 [Alphaproteobacteria bacterium]|nr:MAG: cytochrome P450 [Alphaproteobacteria bacterium]